MKFLSFKKAGFFFLLSVTALISCHSGTSYNNTNSAGNATTNGTGSMDSAQNLNETNFPGNSSKQQHSQYLMQVYANGLYAIQASKEAMTRSSDKNVKKLASFLTDTHTQLNKKINNIAANKQISLPGSLTEKQRGLLKTLQSAKEDFDEDFLRQMLNSHKESVNLLNQAQTGSDAGIADWAKEALPEIQECIDRISSCQNEIVSKTGKN